jgi:hypothetical protein
LPFTVGSFYVRRSIGVRLWRCIHFGVFAVFAVATVHGVTSKSDSGASVYWTAAGTIFGTENARNNRGGGS